MAQLNVTELDFDRIKNNLIRYFRRSDGPFKDWNFSGSGLSQLMDLLAYNTHYNAMIAHLALNESYLDSSQKRSNVVSHAKMLGYTPSSKAAARATVNVRFNRSAGGAESFTLPANTKFSSVVDGVTYSFTTETSITAQIDGAAFIFNDVTLIQGAVKTQTYTIDNSYNQKLTINDLDVDISTLKVTVYDSLTSNFGAVYSKYSDISDLNDQSRIYFCQENRDGYYEVYFGDNVIGKQPNAGGRVLLEYKTTKGADANGANVFSYEDNLSNVSIVSVTTSASASGGALKENNASIKFNAPLTFASQNRAVTSSDYKALIKGNISGIEDVLAWGGETESSIDSGVVYIAAKPTGANFLTNAQKELILGFLATKKMIGIRNKIVDATFTYLIFNVAFTYDQNATSLTAGELADKVRNGINVYNANELNNFSANFRHSRFVHELDSVDRAIISTRAEVLARKTIIVTKEQSNNEVINFGFPLAGTVSQPAPMILKSTEFMAQTVEGESLMVVLEDEPIDGNTERRRVYARLPDIDNQQTGEIVKFIAEVGYLRPAIGEITLDNLIPSSDTQEINLRVKPASLDVYTDKRNILQIDVDSSNVVGTPEILSSGPVSGAPTPGTSSGGGGSTGSGTY